MNTREKDLTIAFLLIIAVMMCARALWGYSTYTDQLEGGCGCSATAEN